MRDDKIEALAATVGGLPIQSNAYNMHYIVCKDDRNRVAVVADGRIILTKKQALTLAKELPEIIKEYCGA